MRDRYRVHIVYTYVLNTNKDNQYTIDYWGNKYDNKMHVKSDIINKKEHIYKKQIGVTTDRM